MIKILLSQLSPFYVAAIVVFFARLFYDIVFGGFSGK